VSQPTPKLIPVLRTSDDTTNGVRVLTQELAAEMGGLRLSHDRVIAAMTTVARNHRAEMLETLRAA
jgi:hypothetical protein